MKEITEDYCDFETAKLLKEKGFDEDIDLWYDENGEIFGYPKYDIGCNWRVRQGLKIYQCSTLQMTMRWLREKHKLFIDITAAMEDYIEDGVVKYKDPYYTWEVFSLEIGETLCFDEAQNVKKSYEEACKSAIKYCLENLI